ncbi:hypothetical protein ACOMICROBIO_FLGHMIGD_04048 [Vibrio sp. B1FLJ16]|nr:hypothetical protein ACOMICROBIO_FLGHMIGD_04048 [Vibrio sp. B1FLJ16]CAE6940879.1 hypothetical protein ACOMICROBIO_FLGHMIGD_04048 [Vibrio sp. B1FLJ16]
MNTTKESSHALVLMYEYQPKKIKVQIKNEYILW